MLREANRGRIYGLGGERGLQPVFDRVSSNTPVKIVIIPTRESPLSRKVVFVSKSSRISSS